MAFLDFFGREEALQEIDRQIERRMKALDFSERLNAMGERMDRIQNQIREGDEMVLKEVPHIGADEKKDVHEKLEICQRSLSAFKVKIQALEEKAELPNESIEDIKKELDEIRDKLTAVEEQNKSSEEQFSQALAEKKEEIQQELKENFEEITQREQSGNTEIEELKERLHQAEEENQQMADRILAQDEELEAIFEQLSLLKESRVELGLTEDVEEENALLERTKQKLIARSKREKEQEERLNALEKNLGDMAGILQTIRENFVNEETNRERLKNEQDQEIIDKLKENSEILMTLQQVFAERGEKVDWEKEREELRKTLAEDLKAHVKEEMGQAVTARIEALEKEVGESRVAAADTTPRAQEAEDFKMKQVAQSERAEIGKEKAQPLLAKMAELEVREDAPNVALFALKGKGRILFPNDRDAVRDGLETIADMEALFAYLEDSEAEAKNFLLKTLQQYDVILAKKIKSIDLSAILNKELSEQMTDLLFDILCKRVLLPISDHIYRDFGSNPEFYKGFLERYNRYLEQCCIETEKIAIGDKFSENHRELLEIFPVKTDKRSLQNRIAEMHRLPYIARYVDAENELQTECLKGIAGIWAVKA